MKAPHIRLSESSFGSILAWHGCHGGSSSAAFEFLAGFNSRIAFLPASPMATMAVLNFFMTQHWQKDILENNNRKKKIDSAHIARGGQNRVMVPFNGHSS
jgi:hypothetical protein